MSNKKGHRIANEVKADIIRRVKEEGVSVSQAAKDHGISTATIYTWLGTGAGAAGTPQWGEFSRLQKQNRELFEVVGELTVQLSSAKKKG